MAAQTKNLLIGIFVLAGLGIIVYILLFLHPKVGDAGQTIRVRFTDIDKISINTRVLFAGHPVGVVTNIEEVEDARELKVHYKDKVYIYELTLQIDSGVIIYTTDQISPMTSGLLGERSVLITPMRPKEDKELVRVTDQILYSIPPASIEETVQIVGDFTEKLNEGLATLEKEHFWENLSGVAEAIASGLDTLEEEKFWENMGGTAESLASIMDSADKPEEIESFISNASEFSHNLNNDLYLRATSLLSKGETVMDDINHYGLLFNTNKNWQRMRARRVNIMSKLSTPQEFSNFFQDEVNQISTSLARVNMLLNDGDCSGYWRTLCSPEFEKVFVDLLRRIDGLEQNIKLVNQQVVESREECCTER
jgi:phospholipid/cholesterol/gamma-HCH transport system substrate-binding protein